MKADVTTEDVDLIFLIFDDDNNGIIHDSEFRNVAKKIANKIQR